jgi:hypothetical protein
MVRTNKFTLLDGAMRSFGGLRGKGLVGKACRQRRGVEVRDFDGERPAEAAAKQENTGLMRKQFVKKFVSEQWILSCNWTFAF